jgi:hypothetical protein
LIATARLTAIGADGRSARLVAKQGWAGRNHSDCAMSVRMKRPARMGSVHAIAINAGRCFMTAFAVRSEARCGLWCIEIDSPDLTIGCDAGLDNPL